MNHQFFVYREKKYDDIVFYEYHPYDPYDAYGDTTDFIGLKAYLSANVHCEHCHYGRKLYYTALLPFDERNRELIEQVRVELQAAFDRFACKRTTIITGILDAENSLPRTVGHVTAIRGRYIMEKIFMTPLEGMLLADGKYVVKKNKVGSYYISSVH